MVSRSPLIYLLESGLYLVNDAFCPKSLIMVFRRLVRAALLLWISNDSYNGLVALINDTLNKEISGIFPRCSLVFLIIKYLKIDYKQLKISVRTKKRHDLWRF